MEKRPTACRVGKRRVHTCIHVRHIYTSVSSIHRRQTCICACRVYMSNHAHVSCIHMSSRTCVYIRGYMNTRFWARSALRITWHILLSTKCWLHRWQAHVYVILGNSNMGDVIMITRDTRNMCHEPWDTWYTKHHTYASSRTMRHVIHETSHICFVTNHETRDTRNITHMFRHEPWDTWYTKHHTYASSRTMRHVIHETSHICFVTNHETRDTRNITHMFRHEPWYTWYTKHHTYALSRTMRHVIHETSHILLYWQ